MQISININPRKAFRPYLERKERWACIVAHRRGGKTYCCIQDLVHKAATNSRVSPAPRYAYIAPTRDQAKDIAWAYIKEFLGNLPGVTINESELKVTLPNGASIRLYSGDSYERMRGVYLDGVVIDEPSDIDPQAWDTVIRPCLVDYKGWATFIGTPKGRNGFWKIHRLASSDPDWFSLVLKASDSGILEPAELAAIKASTQEDQFNQEFECDFTVGMPGAVYADLLERAHGEGRVLDFPWSVEELVFTSWDLGSPANTRTMYWQFIGREVYMIDHDSGLDLLPAQRVAHMLAKGYSYGNHFFPHDASAVGYGGRSFKSQMTEAGLSGIVVLPRCQSPWVGINKCRELLTRMIIHKSRCALALASLECYHTRENKADAHVTSSPVHDWSSHDADAFRYIGEATLHSYLKSQTDVFRGQVVKKPKVRGGVRLRRS